MIVIKQDLIGDDGNFQSRVGTVVTAMPLYGIERAAGFNGSIPMSGQRIEFRLKDDDGEIYYVGELDDDEESLNQQAALRWGESDAGCTTIEVKRDGKWIQEIG